MSEINISQIISIQLNKGINDQISILTERNIEKIQKSQDNLINDLAKKQEESIITIKVNII